MYCSGVVLMQPTTTAEVDIAKKGAGMVEEEAWLLGSSAWLFQAIPCDPTQTENQKKKKNRASQFIAKMKEKQSLCREKKLVHAFMNSSIWTNL
jgi:hypothetical protein